MMASRACQERDLVAEALQVAERRHAAAVAVHGALLAELAEIEQQLLPLVMSRSGRSTGPGLPLMFNLENVPQAPRALLLRQIQLRGKDSEVGLIQQAGTEATRLERVIQRGRDMLKHLDTKLLEQERAAV